MPLHPYPLPNNTKFESSLNLAKKTDLLILVLAALESKDRLCGKAAPSYLLPKLLQEFQTSACQSTFLELFFFWWCEGMPSVMYALPFMAPVFFLS